MQTEFDERYEAVMSRDRSRDGAFLTAVVTTGVVQALPPEHLSVEGPLDAAALLAFLGRRAVPGIEEAGPGWYRRSLSLPSGAGVVELRAGPGGARTRLWLDDPRDAAHARGACARMLSADPRPATAALGADPALAPLVRRTPGLRVPGHPDGGELAIRAVLGQQVSVRAARTVAARMVERLGTPLRRPVGGVTHRFPAPARLAAAPDAALPMPAARRRAVRALAGAVAGGLVLAPGADARAALLALPGIGPWTVEYVALRALADPDAFPATDLGVRHAARLLGLPEAGPALAERSQRWRPWRGLATIHLWAALDS